MSIPTIETETFTRIPDAVRIALNRPRGSIGEA